ncbi:hypothetical protein [Ramlibacter sp. WS9]|uniref:hypothetical protein n=1 Tax=Ramlibacter sp. WS9 TaxID=1882741 RepID=UPI0011450CFA|nr:hypothetical protein [Ramlibacter sp. WS9]ROZ74306.1 hypothetical protein EEB15_17300 [Ramlibacter sp. WS9]
MSLRTDLLHLSPEALTQAANAGIVKRAVRELEGGYRPQWTQGDDGTLEAAFSDGIRTVWPAATPIQHVRCTCGAASICRHRIILALAYRAGAQAHAAVPAASPGEATDEALARLLPSALLARATAARDGGIGIDVHRASSGEPCDTARLPAATVRFWAGASIEAARCDCVAQAACEHVALGVWAFRVADARDAALPVQRVHLGRHGERLAVNFAPWHALAEALVLHGAAAGPAPVTPALSQALEAARGLKATWLVHLLQDIEKWSGAYAARSALYRAEDGFALLAELGLRLNAGQLPGSAQAVLGIGQGDDTELDRLRLICLGARTTRDGEARRARLVLADADTGTALVGTHEWTVPSGEPINERVQRATQRLAPGVRLDALAQGQLLARQARRRADGSLSLARSRGSQNSVLPQVPDWGSLGPPLRYDSVEALRAQQQSHPTVQVLPRHAARRFAVFSPAAVESVVYDPVTQTLGAVLHDASGQPLLVRRSHENHVREALDALAAAMTGSHGPVRHVAGVLHWTGDWPVLDPWAVACDSIVVPDFAPASDTLAQLPLGRLPEETAHPVGAALARLRGAVAELLHHGLVQLPAGWNQQCLDAGRTLSAHSLHTLAGRLDGLRIATLSAQANPRQARLAPLLLQLTALAQLHDDALVLAGLAPAG